MMAVDDPLVDVGGRNGSMIYGFQGHGAARVASAASAQGVR
jgi:hypothetical protein